MGKRQCGDQRPDEELVVAACAGDKAAFADLVTRHRAMALMVARRMLVGSEIASDVVQEATVVALVSLDRLRARDRFGVWLCGITLNVARRWLRELRLEARLLLGGEVSWAPGADEVAERAEMAQLVRAAVDTLANGQRQAVLLFYWLGLSHSELADELGISVGAVKARLHQARSALEPKLTAVIETKEVVVMPAAPPPQWVDASITEVRRAASDDPIRRVHVAVVDERDGSRRLPIYIGPSEAVALAVNLESVEMPRPMTYQLAANLVGAAEARIIEVRITRLVEDTYYAVVIVEGPNGPTEVDARPSDGLNLALVAGAPIRVDRTLFEQPAAVGHTEWQSYPTSTSQIVDEARQRYEESMAIVRRQRESEPPRST